MPLLPVAMTSVSYGSTTPEAPVTCFRPDVDRLDAIAGVEHDAVLRVPRQRVDEDVLGLVASGQHAREQDAVVVAVRLVAEHGDRERAASAAGEHLLDQPGAGHAVADHDQTPRAAHAGCPAAAVATRAAHTLNSGIRLIGSSAAFVNRLADCSPPQWNGTNTVSSRIVGVTLNVKVAVPRRVVS